MTVFPPSESFFIHPHLCIMALLFRCQNKIAEKTSRLLSLVFPIITVISTPKVRDIHKHTPFNFFSITISINVFTAKVKTHKDNSMHKLRIYPKSDDSNWTPIGLETEPETILNYCRNCTGTKQRLLEI